MENSRDRFAPFELNEKTIINDAMERFVGNVKWFNVSQGYGFVIPDNTNEDVFVHQSAIRMDGFRSLGEGERVSFHMRERASGNGKEAFAVAAEDPEQPLVGSAIRPLGKKKETKIRCFKCGQFGQHMANKCRAVATDEKVCYGCGIGGHLYNDCPKRAKRNERKNAGKASSSEEKSDPIAPVENVAEKAGSRRVV